ncbi:diguanylate cyclase [Chitinimonas lacunae]|uniref:diguanylate cyclase n=1 Tax=Chitinimonas lacunae TaxID=1963018 RepID=A0ABV8MT93_9NEIS
MSAVAEYDREQIAALIEEAWRQQYIDPDLARTLAVQARDQALLRYDRAALAEASLCLAYCELRYGESEPARQMLVELRPLLLELDNRRALLQLDYGLAVIEASRQDAESAYVRFLELAAEAEQTGTATDRFLIANALGTAAAEAGQQETGLRHFYQALSLAREHRFGPQLALVLSNLGSCQHDAGNYQDAIRFLSESFDRMQTERLDALAPLVAGNLAMCQLAMGATEAAFETVAAYLERPAERRHAARGDQAFFQAIAAHTFAVRGDWERARQHASLALVDAKACGDRRLQAHAWWVSGLVERGLGNAEAALAALRQAELHVGGLNDLYYPIQIYLELAQTLSTLERWQEAFVYLDLHRELQQQSQGSATRVRLQSTRIEHELLEAERERDFALLKQAEAERARRDLEALNLELQRRMAEIEALQSQLREQAIRDPLTDLFNRRYLQNELHSELRLAERRHYRLCVVLIDVDHFKAVNDTYGHPMGDQVLIELATLLRANIRGSDFACRYGGEEFCLVLADIDVAAAIARVSDLLERFRAVRVELAGQTVERLSFSAGVAEYPRDGNDPDSLLRAADQALYRAKDNGRNRIEIVEAKLAVVEW